MLYRVITIAVMLIFYGCHFVKMLAQRKQGIKTNQMGKGKIGFVKFVEVTLGIATILAPAAELVSVIFNTSLLPMWARNVGVVVAVIGLIIFITAVVQMRDSWRAGVPEKDKTELVTGGIFSISRNPAFLGFDLVYMGILLMFFSWWLFMVSVFAALMIHLQIVNVEEEFLLSAFGERYLSYKKRVNRYLGVRK